MIILGIDPGTTRIGFGVVKIENNNLTCLEYGTIENKSDTRLQSFGDTAKNLKEIVSKFGPQKAVVEKLYFFNNQKTVMAVGEMRGVIMATLVGLGIPVTEYTPLEVKKMIAGYGRAEKNQVQKIVKMILKLEKDIKPDDAADALALAICGAGDKSLI